MSYRGGSGGTRRLSRRLPPRRQRGLVHERQGFLGQVQALAELAREITWQGRRLLVKLEGESAVELHALAQGGVGPQTHFEGAPPAAPPAIRNPAPRPGCSIRSLQREIRPR